MLLSNFKETYELVKNKYHNDQIGFSWPKNCILAGGSCTYIIPTLKLKDVVTEDRPNLGDYKECLKQIRSLELNANCSLDECKICQNLNDKITLESYFEEAID